MTRYRCNSHQHRPPLQLPPTSPPRSQTVRSDDSDPQRGIRKRDILASRHSRAEYSWRARSRRDGGAADAAEGAVRHHQGSNHPAEPLVKPCRRCATLKRCDSVLRRTQPLHSAAQALAYDSEHKLRAENLPFDIDVWQVDLARAAHHSHTACRSEELLNGSTSGSPRSRSSPSAPRSSRSRWPRPRRS